MHCLGVYEFASARALCPEATLVFGFRGSLYSMSENDLRHFFVKDTSLLLLAKFKIAAYIRECIFASIFSLFSFFR